MIMTKLFCSCLDTFDASVEILLCRHLKNLEVDIIFEIQKDIESQNGLKWTLI